MVQFKFKRHAAMYKNKKGDKVTISNGNLTDEKAIEFLRTNPERISLFAEYPSNWETLIVEGAKPETKKEKEKRLAMEAEANSSKGSDSKVLKDPKGVKNGLRRELLKLKLKDLRAKYPDVKANSIKDFVREVMRLDNEVKKDTENIEAPKASETKEEAEADENKKAEAAATAEAEAAAQEALE